MKCSYCGKQNAEDAIACSGCGTECERRNQPGLSCPVDGSRLQEVPHGSSSFYTCTTCSGLWLPRHFLVAVAARREYRVADGRPLPPPVSRVHLVACPLCGQFMSQRVMDHVQIDVCLQCKCIWLDRGEIAHLNQAKARKSGSAKAFSAVSPVMNNSGWDWLDSVDVVTLILDILTNLP
jgi:Zn-finger nucleic acid-binding protein